MFENSKIRKDVLEAITTAAECEFGVSFIDGTLVVELSEEEVRERLYSRLLGMGHGCVSLDVHVAIVQHGNITIIRQW